MEPVSWQEFAWGNEEPDARRDRMCAETGDPTRVRCRIEGENFAREVAAPADEIVVCAYNVERGLRLDAQLQAFAGGAGMPLPDILLLSEADRGCSRSGDRNVAREYARALGMYYVFGVEFVELPRLWGPGGGRIRRRCEHGNAILSRYPLGNVRLIRHQRTRSWSRPIPRVLHVGQPRLGGRVALTADVRIGGRLLRVYSVHLESGHRGRWDPDGCRESQVRELIEDASKLSHGVVVGGDMNVVRYLGLYGEQSSGEPATSAMFAAGFEDAHAAIPRQDRITVDSGFVIDLILGRNVSFSGAGIGPRPLWGGLSDHLPVWTRVIL